MNKNSYIPIHLGIIMDGNRRWARSKNQLPFTGHQAGYETLKKSIIWCKESGIKYLTVFAFSSENWNRSPEEVSLLMNLAMKVLEEDLGWFLKEDVKIKAIGERDRLDTILKERIVRAESKTENNKGIVLIIAISYGGRREIVHALRKMTASKIRENQIDESSIESNLWTAGLPDVDLIIRTGGEQRLSGFLLWQAAYAELYFLFKYWPDFSKEDLERALIEYAQRRRNFGK